MAPYFSYDIRTGAITVASSHLNYECDRFDALPGCPIRTVVLSVVTEDDGDGNLTDVVDITVRILNVAEAPIVPPNITLEVDEFTAPPLLLLPYPTLSRPGQQAWKFDFYCDDRDPLQFAIVAGNGFQGAMFEVDAGDESTYDSGTLVFDPTTTSQYPYFHYAAGILDYFETRQYNLTLSVTHLTFTLNVSMYVRVVFVRQNPEILRGHRLVGFNVTENCGGGVVAGQLHSVSKDRTYDFWYEVIGVDMIAYDGSVESEVANSLSDAFEQTWTVELKTGKVMTRYPSFGQTSVIDYETYVGYNITIRVWDRALLDPQGLSDHVVVYVAVKDVNDLTITSVIAPGGPLVTIGGQSVIITGTNFGPVRGDPTLYIDVRYRCTTEMPASACWYNATNCQIIVPNTVLRCTSAPGSGVRHSWFVDVAHQPQFSQPLLFGAQAQTTSYAPPLISSLVYSPLSTRGGDVVSVVGVNFGPPGTPVSASYGLAFAYFPTCVVVGQAQASCAAVPGVGAGLPWRIVIDTQQSMLSTATTAYAVPSISRVRRGLNSTGGVVNIATLPTVGGDALLIDGANFGPSDSVRYAGYPHATISNGRFEFSTSCTITVAHAQLSCVNPAGVGKQFHWAVSVDGQVSTPSGDTTTYQVPVVTRIFGDGAFGSPTKGGSRVFLAGSNFGPALADGSVTIDAVRYGHGNVLVPWWFSAAGCTIAQPHVLLQCAMGVGTGKDHTWQVAIGALLSPMHKSTTYYGSPFVVGFAGAATPKAMTDGGQSLQMRGQNFGANQSMIQSVTYGPTGEEFVAGNCTLTVPHVEMTCITAEGAGRLLQFRVIVDDLASAAPQSQYQPPQITAITQPPWVNGLSGWNTRGGEFITVSGSNFGGTSPVYIDAVWYGPGQEYTMSVRRSTGDGASCAVTVPHFDIVCTTLPGVGFGLRWMVSVLDQLSNPSDTLFSYLPPDVTRTVYVRVRTRLAFPCGRRQPTYAHRYVSRDRAHTHMAFPYGRRPCGIILLCAPLCIT